MSFRVQTFRCSLCGTVKQQANHWRIAYIGTTLTGLARLDRQLSKDDATSRLNVFSVAEWDELLAEHTGVYPACGNNCTQKLLERWLFTKSLEDIRGNTQGGH